MINRFLIPLVQLFFGLLANLAKGLQRFLLFFDAFPFGLFFELFLSLFFEPLLFFFGDLWSWRFLVPSLFLVLRVAAIAIAVVVLRVGSSLVVVVIVVVGLGLGSILVCITPLRFVVISSIVFCILVGVLLFVIFFPTSASASPTTAFLAFPATAATAAASPASTVALLTSGRLRHFISFVPESINWNKTRSNGIARNLFSMSCLKPMKNRNRWSMQWSC
mmetsp:Transcript_8922/g.22042  ORF Transcript_8922/g.22042 Transcript_8922/m.22042 type:complete len:220 (-) Transcript_8922:39-698(-)